MVEPAVVPSLRRHQLAYLAAAGWRGICGRDWDETAAACLAHWAAHDLPLVVTRQAGRVDESGDDVAMGLQAPGRWGRRRIALRVPRHALVRLDEFPSVDAVARLLPVEAHEPWRRLCGELEALGAIARVHGSYGWQQISGLDHVHSGSDVDIVVAVSSAEHADAAARTLQAFACPRLRLDGELVFAGGTAAAWREWIAWRAGRVKTLLLKTVAAARLASSIAEVDTSDRMEATA